MTMAPGQYVSVTSPAQVVTTTNTSSTTNVNGKVVVNGSLFLGNEQDNTSTDLEHWEVQEFRKFIKWYINMHNPEAIEQFLAIRKIEKANEEQEELARRIAHNELIRELVEKRKEAIKQLQSQQPMSIWDKMKQMAGYGKPEHGDYY